MAKMCLKSKRRATTCLIYTLPKPPAGGQRPPGKKPQFESGLNQQVRATGGFGEVYTHRKPGKKNLRPGLCGDLENTNKPAKKTAQKYRRPLAVLRKYWPWCYSPQPHARWPSLTLLGGRGEEGGGCKYGSMVFWRRLVSFGVRPRTARGRAHLLSSPPSWSSSSS